jgi:hypothetical protein
MGQQGEIGMEVELAAVYDGSAEPYGVCRWAVRETDGAKGNPRHHLPTVRLGKLPPQR